MELIVVGFHRSGTSLVTQLLHAGGLFVGDRLLGSKPSNPYGHFEDLDVLRVHRRILAANETNWQVDRAQEMYIDPTSWARMRALVERRRAAHETWGFKDPRIGPFLGAWKHLMPDAKFLLVYRDPADCVRSLHSRQSDEYFDAIGDSTSHLRFFREADHGLRLWDTFNRAAVAFARRYVDDCLVLPYSLVPQGYPVIAAVNERFGAGLREVPTEEIYDASAVGRTESPQWVHDPRVADRVDETWRALEEMTARTEPR